MISRDIDAGISIDIYLLCRTSSFRARKLNTSTCLHSWACTRWQLCTIKGVQYQENGRQEQEDKLLPTAVTVSSRQYCSRCLENPWRPLSMHCIFINNSLQALCVKAQPKKTAAKTSWNTKAWIQPHLGQKWWRCLKKQKNWYNLTWKAEMQRFLSSPRRQETQWCKSALLKRFLEFKEHHSQAVSLDSLVTGY